jgi:hypothetical protein
VDPQCNVLGLEESVRKARCPKLAEAPKTR